MENVMCHVRMVVRRSTLAYHNFVFESGYATSRTYMRDSKMGEVEERGYKRRQGE
jgi:hypothetical protein